MVYHPFRHLGLKVLAVAIASLLWLSVTRDAIVERSLRVPLEFQNIPERLEIVGDPPGTVDVRVRGASSLLSRIEPGDVVAVLDLRGARSGQRLFHLITDQVRAPFGIAVAQVTPPTVSLQFETSGSRVVPVVPTVEGDPAPGYVAGPVRSNPPTVEVVGPESHLDRLQQATTEPVSIENARALVEDTVTVGVADSALRLRTARTATVFVDILPAPIERTLADVPVRSQHLVGGRTAIVQPATATVVLRGTREMLAGVRPETVKIYVDLATLGPGRYTVPIRVDPGEEFGVIRIDPPSTQVRIR
jgi:YbbR domain-containing protein